MQGTTVSSMDTGIADDGRMTARPRELVKPLLILLLAVAVIIGGIYAWQRFLGKKTRQYMGAMASAPQTVSTAVAVSSVWQSRTQALGNVRAVRGADLAAQASGVVDRIHIESGTEVPAGTVLLTLRANDDPAKLAQLQAQADLSAITLKRDREQLAAQAISQATVDSDASSLESARAQVLAQKALIEEKTVRAPFAGRLGLRQVDEGQYLAAGTTVVTLQALDPIFIDFYVPQQALSHLKPGQAVSARVDAYPGTEFSGKLISINSKVDASSRNVQMRASFSNPDRRLVPGMYANVDVDNGDPTVQITLPQAAVTYNPYGDTVYIVQKSGVDEKGNPRLTVQQRFVQLGDTRGDQVAVEERHCGRRRGGDRGPDEAAQRLGSGDQRQDLTEQRPEPDAPERVTHAMNFTDIFIRRPVLATVVSLVILVVGMRSYGSLQVLAYPKTENGTVTISTAFPGADPDSIAGFITTPIEAAVAQANGIDYMTSISQSSTSTITVNLRQNYDSSKAAAEINIKVNSVLNQLPAGSQQPSITVKTGSTTDAMYMGFSSPTLERNQVTDYLQRVVQPKLQAVPGVQTAELIGGQYFSLRAWLDPKKLAAYGITASDVSTALSSNDYISAVGNTKGQMVQVTLTSTTSLHSLSEFRDMVVKQVNGANIRLGDVATVALGADSYDTRVAFDDKPGVFIGIQVAPSANLLDRHQRREGGFSGHPSATTAGIERPDHLRRHQFRE